MRRTVLVVLIAVVVFLFVFAGARQILKSRKQLPKSITELQTEMGIPVEVAEVTEGIFILSSTYLGTIEGTLQSDIVPVVAATIVDIPVKVGDRVKKDEVICRLDTKASMAQYDQLKLAYEDASLDAERMEKLYLTGAVSQQMLEKAKLNRDIAKENLENSSKVVALVAPFEGIVTEIFLREGEITQIDEPVVRVADLGRVKVKFSVNYGDWKSINHDTPVFFRISGDGTEEISGKIVDVSLAADPESRLFSVWGETDNREGKLHSGLLVDVRLEIVQKPQAVLVPRDAVVVRRDRRGVFVVGDDKKARFTPVEIGYSNPAQMEVTSGLAPGQVIVVYGHSSLEDGQLVNVVQS